MKTPDRSFIIKNARKTLRRRDQKILQLKERLDSLTLQSGVELNSEQQEEIDNGIEIGNAEVTSLPSTDFKRIFWEQQVCSMFVSNIKIILCNFMIVCNLGGC